MPDDAGEKSLDPTPHRRQQARREGHVAKSHDLGSAAMLLAGLAVLMMLGGGLAKFLVDYCRSQLGSQPWLAVDAESVVGHWNATLWALGRYLLPILGLLCLAGAAVNVLQIGFLFLPQRLAFDLARLDPLQGLRRIFSTANLVQLGFGIFKLVAVLGVAGVVLYNQRNAILGLIYLAPSAIAMQVTQIVLWTALKVGAALLVLALLDYAYQWWRHEQDLKMTPQELQEELRNLEGNPQVIARRKQAQRDLALQRQQGK
jgi:flagellar biosynthetic protein FlhB